ncbi:MAG: hypothetical protein KAK04_15720, partial [Cyclobacteriaceae bacterium]|nr:hypothetical protein [Cyclobacteriaceae bacterium]
MRTNRTLIYLIFIVIFLAKASQSHSQEIDLDKLISHSWVDSVFESLTITERINQLLVLDIGENPSIQDSYPTAY